MKRDELTELLWIDAKGVASSFHLGIEEDCETSLRKFIEGGTGRLADEKLLGDPRRVGQAETHLIAFVGGMAFQARYEHLAALTVFTFETARKIFCPLYPFC